LLGVRSDGEVDVLVSPTAPMPRKNAGRRSRLIEEHAADGAILLKAEGRGCRS